MIYAGNEKSTIRMTVGGGVRIAEMIFEIMGEGTVDYPVLTVNGGYFGVDPRTWQNVEGAGAGAVVISSEPEEYNGQTDWEADSDVYTWRVVLSGDPLDLDGNGVVNIGDVTTLLNVLSGSGTAARDCDLDGSGGVDIGDATVLINALASA